MLKKQPLRVISNHEDEPNHLVSSMIASLANLPQLAPPVTAAWEELHASIAQLQLLYMPEDGNAASFISDVTDTMVRAMILGARLGHN